MKDIYIFICEDQALAKELISKYFNKEQITYAEMRSEEERAKITSALEATV